jgi:hypothetical protein
MQLIGAMMVISILSLSAFCFYCGVISISEKIKVDGLLAAIKVAVVIFLVTTFILIGVGRVRNLFSNANTNYSGLQRV